MLACAKWWNQWSITRSRIASSRCVVGFHFLGYIVIEGFVEIIEYDWCRDSFCWSRVFIVSQIMQCFLTVFALNTDSLFDTSPCYLVVLMHALMLIYYWVMLACYICAYICRLGQKQNARKSEWCWLQKDLWERAFFSPLMDGIKGVEIAADSFIQSHSRENGAN